MPNYLTRSLRCNIILLSLIVILKTSASTENNLESTKLSHVAKRSFLFKEREFLKVKPLSNEMKSFISKHKKRSKNRLDRSKREEVNKNHMYAIQNGELVPLKSLTSAPVLGNSLSSFTVVPLIVPVTVRNNDNQIYNSISSRSGITVDTIEEREDTSCIEDDTVKTVENEKGNDTNINELLPTETPDTPTTLGTILPETPFTKAAEDRLYLNKVVEDVRGLLTFQREGKSLSNEGALCSVFGDWDSDAGGMQLRIEKSNNTNITIQLQHPLVTVVEREPQMEGGFLCDGLWNITAQVPYNHSSVVILIAASPKRKRIATFIGECRICEGTETITGDWMLGRCSRNCKDRQESHSYFTDVLRKNNIRDLQKAHLKQIMIMGSKPTHTTEIHVDIF